MEVIVWAETESWATREPDPDDRWDNGDTEGRVKEVLARIKNDPHKTNYWGDSICKEFPDDTTDIWAVVADYESGNTFGRSGGFASVLDAFATPEEAEALREAALNKNRQGYSFSHNGKNYYRSWVGYFEILQELKVWHIKIGCNCGATH